jgi:hypothetical protein
MSITLKIILFILKVEKFTLQCLVKSGEKNIKSTLIIMLYLFITYSKFLHSISFSDSYSYSSITNHAVKAFQIHKFHLGYAKISRIMDQDVKGRRGSISIMDPFP